MTATAAARCSPLNDSPKTNLPMATTDSGTRLMKADARNTGKPPIARFYSPKAPRAPPRETKWRTPGAPSSSFLCTANVASRDEIGNPARVIEISRDITERKQAEAEKDRLIEKLREAYEKIPAG